MLNGDEKQYRIYADDNADKFTVRDAHILVVDDNRMNLHVAGSLLSRYNIKVTTANSGREALEKIESCNYDFVFMDHMMPEMDGVETMKHIRRKQGSYFKNVPIVALTANAVAGTREMLLSLGFSDFLEKPIERSVFERVLKRNLAPEKIIIGDLKQEQEVKLQTKTEEKKEESMEEMTKEMKEEAPTLLELLEREGLNTQRGIMYCGGEESYIEVLQSFCEDYKEMYNAVEELYAAQDWENYTITVHGIKSSMGSIGAEEIQELAKQLEFAGKENRIDFIHRENANLLEKYMDFFKRLLKIEALGVADAEEVEEAEETSAPTELRVLQMDEFAEILEEMENAMYALDKDTLLELLEGIRGCEYAGKPLDDAVNKAIRKVEMADYMSAVDMLSKQMIV